MGELLLPSAALQKFEQNMLIEVDRIIESHSLLNHEGHGRRGLGHITRSGVLMACAAWELYLEEVLMESVRILIDRVDSPSKLPKPVQKEIAKAVRESKHELKALEMAGDGWATVYDHQASLLVMGLNTPKSSNVDSLFERLVGIEDLSSHWSIGATELNRFVTVRGDIAHRGKDAGYVRIMALRDYRTKIHTSVIDTDNALADFIQASTDDRSPWRRRAV